MEFPGALYHVMSRGNNRRLIFHDKQDYMIFLDRMKKYHDRYDFNLLAYVLMPNHFHLLMKTGQVPLSKIMQGWLESFTLFYNKKYQAVGHLCQGRYKAVLCQESAYLLTLVRYIHNNPVRAGLCVRAENYPWSSYPLYLGQGKADLIERELVLVEFSDHPVTALREFLRFMSMNNETDESSLQDELKKNSVLGSEAFIERVKNLLVSEPGVIRQADKPISAGIKLLDRLLVSVSEITGVQQSGITSGSRCRETAHARRLFALAAVEHLGYKNKDVAAFIHRDESHVSNMIRRFHEEQLKDNEVVQKLNRIIKVINV